MRKIDRLLESAHAEITELRPHLPSIHPHPELYRCALYLEKFSDSLRIGRTNIGKLTSGAPKLEKRFG